MDEQKIEGEKYKEGLEDNEEISSRVNHFKKLLLTWVFWWNCNPWDLVCYLEEHRIANNTDYKRKDAT